MTTTIDTPEAQLQRMERRLRLLSDLSRELADVTADYPQLLALIARRLGERMGEGCVLRMMPVPGAELASVDTVYHPDPAKADAWKTWMRAHPQRFDSSAPGQVLIDGLGLTTMMAVPLQSERGVTIGAVVVARSDPNAPFTEADQELVEDLALHASIAITNSRLLAALKRELAERDRLTARLRVLSELTREFALATGSYDQLLELLARRLSEVIGEMCALRMLAEDGLIVQGAIWHRDPQVLEAIHAVGPAPQRLGEGFTGRVLETGQSVLIPVVLAEIHEDAAPAFRELAGQLAIRSVLAVPLRSAGKPIGVAIMTRSAVDHPYTRDDLTLLEDIASHASIALTNASLLETANRELAERLRTEEQLRQVQKMEAIGQLAGGIAHDFNNLLSVVLSYVVMMLDEIEVTNPMRDDLIEIKRAGERAADLTRQLLAFSRQQIAEPRVIDLNEIIAGMANMNRRLIGESIEYHTVASPELGKIKADPRHIEQVILNLVVNARDAMPTGGRLTIATENMFDDAVRREHPELKPGPHVGLSVTDTGGGMDQATRQRIFEPFFTTKAVGKGTGLGLSTVFGIVQQNGGMIWVFSEPGNGTSFKICFPRTDEALAASVPRTSIASLRGWETILVVDDEDQLRAVACGVLQRQGYRVLGARSGAEALVLSKTHPGVIHLLLTDVVMPQMSGRELAQRLQPLRPEMRVLYMSGYAGEVIAHHGVLDPGIKLLQKPLIPESLLRGVREALDRR